MSLSAYAMSVETFAPMLRGLSELLDKGAEHAKAAALEPETLVKARLAPDMYSLATQVTLACYHAENGAAQLTGRERPPPQSEVEGKTFDELKDRIAKALDYLESSQEASFESAETRAIEIPIPNDMVIAMNGAEFLRDWALPHFYFHLVTAYDILRHNGVSIGKRDYARTVSRHIRPRRDQA
jgi:hypothetical protein